MKIGLVAGEASGDLLAAGLMRAIRKRHPDATFEGVAGPAMAAEGCDVWADAEELAIFGLLEPLVHLPRLLRLRRSLVERWKASPPDVFVGIDAPDFNLGLEKKLRKAGIKTAHYVSPSVWVWRAGRIETVREAADRVLCILPFEKKIYDDKGIDAVFVGHPKATSLPTDIDLESVREVLDIGDGPVIAMLPGSRVGEIKRLGPELVRATALLAKQRDDLHFVTPIASSKLRPLIEDLLNENKVADRYTLIDGDSIEAMSAADIVLLASGTAALESALLGKPTVAAYGIGKLSGVLVRMIGLHNKYFTIPNLIADELLIPEFIQEEVIAEDMAQAVWDLLEDPERCAEISRRFVTLRTELALGADERAADAVIELAE